MGVGCRPQTQVCLSFILQVYWRTSTKICDYDYDEDDPVTDDDFNDWLTEANAMITARFAELAPDVHILDGYKYTEDCAG
jgi:hypothetical protein